MRSACPIRSRIRTHLCRPMQYAPSLYALARARAREESRPVHSTSPPALLRHGFIFNRATHHGTRLRQLCCITPGASPSCPPPPPSPLSLSLALSLFLFLFFSRHIDACPPPSCSSFFRSSCSSLPSSAAVRFFLFLSSRFAATLVFIAPADGATRRPGAPCVSHIYAPRACLPPRKERACALHLLLLLLRSR